ncbi:MAG: hypothetical protein K1X86_02710 [Ignavibacteria bacterium]|nr:hypothetical protein [Ignavibacteria bacterium]
MTKSELTNKFIVLADDVLLLLGKGEIDSLDPLVKCSVFIKEAFIKNNINVIEDNDIKLKNPDFFEKAPEMLLTCLMVYTLMKKNKFTFKLAVHKVALEKTVQESSIRQACCRNLKLNAIDWNKFYFGKEESFNKIKEKLLERYPYFKLFIEQNFN